MASDLRTADHLVVFVCAHGALRSRLAAALFNQLAPPGWTAKSAGLKPQTEHGETAARLLVGLGFSSLMLALWLTLLAARLL